MKTIKLLSVMLISCLYAYTQTYIDFRKPMRMIYNNDTMTISFSGDTVKIYGNHRNFKIADLLKINELVVRDTTILNLIREHAGGSGNQTDISHSYYPDVSSNIDKKISNSWYNAITISKNWTGIAISETGKYRTATAFNSYIYVSSDFGITWNTKSILSDWERVSMSNDGKYQAAISYILNNYGYIYISSDYGETWIQSSAPYLQYEGINVSYNGKYIIAGGGTSHELVFSSNYGQTWTNIAPNNTGTWSEAAISENGKYLLICDYASNNIYTSNNSGVTWTQHNLNTYSWFGATMSASGQYQAVVSTIDDYVYISRDYGETWIKTSTGFLFPKTGISMSLSGKYIYACGNSGVVYSTDYGETWNLTSPSGNIRKVAVSGDGTNASVASINNYIQNSVPYSITTKSLTLTIPFTIGNQNIQYVMSDTLADPDYVRNQIANYQESDPILKKDINRNIYDTWSLKGSAEAWKTIAISGNNGKYQVAAVSNGYIYISSDYGNTWTMKTAAGARNWYWAAISDDGKYMTVIVYAGTIYISSDYGYTWSSVESSRNWTSVSMSSSGQYQLATVNGSYIYVSSDYGATWNPKGSSGNYWASACSSTGQYMVVGAQTGTLYVSSNYGNNWTSRGSSLDWSALAVSATGEYMVGATIGGKIYTSNNYGTNWSVQNNSPTSIWTSVDISNNGNIIIASAYNNNYIYVSDDFGITWSRKGISGNWRQVSITNNAYIASAILPNIGIYISSLIYDFNYYPSVSNWQNIPTIDKMLITKGYSDSYFHGNLTDGAPTASEINSITNLNPETAGVNRKLLIKDDNGTELYYWIISTGTNWIYFPGISGTIAY